MLYEVRTAWFLGDQTSWSGPRGPSHLLCQSLPGGACGAQWVAILQAVDAARSARTGKYWRVRTAVRDLGCVPNKEHRLATCSGPPYLRGGSASHQPRALEWHWQLGQDKIAHAGLWRGFPVLLAVLVNTLQYRFYMLSRDFA